MDQNEAQAEEAHHKIYMQRALQLARLGRDKVSPNPMVGAVIVHRGRIIGEGYHTRYGAAHAEVEALRNVQNKDLLKESTIYVTLEPCAHYGNTPPCSLAIREAGLKKVVVACTDPDQRVAGKGLRQLRDAGIEVVEGMEEQAALDLNKAFFVFNHKKRPFVLLKWAQTADGFMARTDGSSKWITGLAARTHTHQLRAWSDAILVGVGTANQDKPSLTTRHVEGADPLRVVLDPHGRLEPNENWPREEVQPTLVVRRAGENGPQVGEVQKGIEVLELSGEDFLHELMGSLHERKIQRLMVEGGPRTLRGFIDAQLWDEALVYTSSQCFGTGIEAPSLALHQLRKEKKCGHDRLKYFSRFDS